MWIGCNCILKMTNLPRFFHLIQTLPIDLTILETGLFLFPRLSLAREGGETVASDPCKTSVGGGRDMGFPDPSLYYRAAHLTCIVDWCCRPDGKLSVQ